MIKFTIPGEPTGKARPRVTKFGVYTAEKTVLYENLVKTCYGQQNKARMMKGHVNMGIKAYFKPPKSASKKKLSEMLENAVRPTKKPDIDNILKIIADALNKIAYEDDAQIVGAVVEKYYAEIPRVEVEITEV